VKQVDVICFDAPCTYQLYDICKRRAKIMSRFSRDYKWMCKAQLRNRLYMEGLGLEAIDWTRTSMMSYRHFMEEIET